MRWSAGAVAAAVLLAPQVSAGQGAQLRPDQAEFRALYKELVEINTTLSSGSCTEAAAKMGARMKAAGFADSELTYFADREHPKEGGLVAILKGSEPAAKPILLLGHLDVVEARREDWTRDPFLLVEEGGYFYGRGTLDMKAMDAIWIDTLIRLKRAGAPPKRTLKMALTCGEETAEAFNGADWLVKNRRDLVEGEFGLTEGGGGRVKADGSREVANLQVGEKAAQNFRLEVTNPGGHSSRPVPDNAIYRLADALKKVQGHLFPVRLNATTRAALAVRAEQKDAVGAAVKTLLANPKDVGAARRASADPSVNNVLRTTCVATRLDAGHASNALPQRATAIVNCRIIPGETVDGTHAALTAMVGDPQVKVSIVQPVRPLAVSPPLDQKIVEPAKRLAAKHFPGVPVTPMMSAGATDGRYFGQINMPIYGAPGILSDPQGNAHGLNERVPVRSVYDGRDYLFDLVREYASAP